MGLRQARAVLAAALVAPVLAFAASGNDDATWTFSANTMAYAPPDGDNFLLVVATADRGPLHLEARYNYEARDTGSVFAGWTLEGGETLTYTFTPMFGVVAGETEGIAPAFKASLAYGVVDFYVEAEYLYDTDVSEDSYTYAWSELGVSPAPWLRFGLVGQRTRVYESSRDIQRGPFAQIVLGKATLGVYVFNPDDSANRLAIVSFAADF